MTGIIPTGEASNFKVSVAKMTESHRVTYWVQLKNTKVDVEFGCGAAGVISPYYTEVEAQAIHIAADWAKFLGVEPETECSCIMCKIREVPRKRLDKK